MVQVPVVEAMEATKVLVVTLLLIEVAVVVVLEIMDQGLFLVVTAVLEQ
jgi:hypothetical protein